MNKFFNKTNEVPAENNTAGIEINVGLHIDHEDKTGLAVHFIRTVIAFLGSLGSVMCFVSAVIPQADVSGAVIWCAVLCGVCMAAAIMKKWGTVLIGVSAAALLGAVWHNRNSIYYGFLSVANSYLSLVRPEFAGYDYYDLSGYAGNTAADISILICLASAFIALTAGVGMIYRTGIIAVFVSTFPTVELVLYYGLVPDYIWLILVIAMWTASVVSEIAEYPVTGADRLIPVYAKVSAQSAGIAAAAVLLCFGLASAGIKLSGYERPDSIKQFRTDFSRYMRSFKWSKFFNDVKVLSPFNNDMSGAINHGKLGRTDSITFNDYTVLTAELLKSDNNVYLKGFTGVEYTGNAWNELSDDAAEKLYGLEEAYGSEGLSSRFLDGYVWSLYSDKLSVNSVTIENINANTDYAYLPYYITPKSAAEYKSERDNIIPPDTVYSCEVYNISDSLRNAVLQTDIMSGDTIVGADEEKYRKFVYDNYLDIPETFTAAEKIYGDVDFTDVKTELYNIKRWLSSYCEYDLEAGKLPFGEDFADYFLTENRKGSCSHFATSAALMCRYRGIPARYCEGYVIKADDFPVNIAVGEPVSIEITDTRAHAWIEIYVDGYGWYPFEVTPGYSDLELVNSTSVQEELSQPDDMPQSLPVEEDVITETTVTENIITEQFTETETEKAEQTEEIAEETTVNTEITEYIEETEPMTAPPSEKKKQPLSAAAVTVIIVLAGVTGLFAARYHLIAKGRKKAFTGKNTAVKSTYACRYFLKLLNYKKLFKTDQMSYEEYAAYVEEKLPILDAESAYQVLGAGLAAKFADAPPSDDDAELAAKTVTRFAEDLYNEMKPAEKFYFRFIHCLK